MRYVVKVLLMAIWDVHSILSFRLEGNIENRLLLHNTAAHKGCHLEDTPWLSHKQKVMLLHNKTPEPYHNATNVLHIHYRAQTLCLAVSTSLDY